MTEPEQPKPTADTPPTTPAAPEVAEAASAAPASDQPAAPSKAFAIGSQRDAADKSLAPSQPKAVIDALANPVNLRGVDEPETVAAPPAVVRSEAGLGDDIDAEIAAALGGISMDLSLIHI